MAYDSITEGLILGALLGALSLQPVMTTMLHLMNMVRKKKTHLFCVWCLWTLDVFSISTTLACTKLWDLDSWSKNYRGHDYVSGIYNLHLTTTPYTGLMRQPKYGHLKQLHEAIKLCEYALVSSDPTVTSLGTYQQVSTQHFLMSVTILFW